MKQWKSKFELHSVKKGLTSALKMFTNSEVLHEVMTWITNCFLKVGRVASDRLGNVMRLFVSVHGSGKLVMSPQMLKYTIRF